MALGHRDRRHGPLKGLCHQAVSAWGAQERRADGRAGRYAPRARAPSVYPINTFDDLPIVRSKLRTYRRRGPAGIAPQALSESLRQSRTDMAEGVDDQLSLFMIVCGFRRAPVWRWRC